MKIIYLFLFLILATASINGQQISLEAGKNSSSFDFKNSQGESLDNLQATIHNFISIGYRKSVFTNDLFLNINGNYNSYGARGSDRTLDNYFEWNLNYVGLELGLDYELYKPGDFSFYIKGAFATEFFIQGTQTLNNQVFDLSKEEDFDSAFYFFKAGLGTEYKASKNIAVFIQYTNGVGNMFKNNQGDLKIKTHNLGLGLRIDIAKKVPDTLKVDTSKLDALKKELETNAQKIKELEENNEQVNALKKEILDKEKEIKQVKVSIAQALQPYSGSDLTIKEEEGKVSITMGNDKLFNSGSSKISPDGIKALHDLGTVFSENADLNILIEGHTDNRPFKNGLMSNWDLSVKRATAVVEILIDNKKIDPKNLMAAGKGEHEPIADNDSEEGRSKNRRIEIIISPKLDELSKLIKN